MSDGESQAQPPDPFLLNPWFRVLAAGVDTLGLGGVAAAFMGVVLSLLRLTGTVSDANENAVVAASVSGLVVAFLAYSAMESSSWQSSIGKSIFRIKVVDMNGHRISFGRSLFRNTVKWISYPIWIVYLIFCFPNPGNFLKPAPKMTTLHDFLSKTRVVAAKNRLMLQHSSAVK